ncbi:hypothetical protein VPH35_106629 [Triticum aestivum]
MHCNATSRISQTASPGVVLPSLANCSRCGIPRSRRGRACPCPGLVVEHLAAVVGMRRDWERRPGGRMQSWWSMPCRYRDFMARELHAEGSSCNHRAAARGRGRGELEGIGGSSCTSPGTLPPSPPRSPSRPTAGRHGGRREREVDVTVW